MEKKVILENYQFSSNTVRIKGEDEYLFIVTHNIDFKRTKKDAGKLAISIVENFNNYERLKADNEVLLEALKTIEARANGDWDNPLLIKHGFLTTEFDNDVLSIVNKAIQKVENK